MSNYDKTAAKLSSNCCFLLFNIFLLSNTSPMELLLKGFTSLLITYSRSILSFLQAVFYCSFFKDTLLAPDACFLFHPATQFLEIQPEILLGNPIPKCSNTVKARQFTLLSSFNQASPRTFHNNLSTAPGLRRSSQRTPRNHKRRLNNQ